MREPSLVPAVVSVLLVVGAWVMLMISLWKKMRRRPPAGKVYARGAGGTWRGPVKRSGRCGYWDPPV